MKITATYTITYDFTESVEHVFGGKDEVQAAGLAAITDWVREDVRDTLQDEYPRADNISVEVDLDYDDTKVIQPLDEVPEGCPLCGDPEASLLKACTATVFEDGVIQDGDEGRLICQSCGGSIPITERLAMEIEEELCDQ